MQNLPATGRWRRHCSAIRTGTFVRLAVIVTVLGLSAAPAAVVAQTDSDIHVASLSREDGRLVVGAPRNVTSRPGYDNQPNFTADGRGILFTRIDGSGQADIWRYDLETGRSEAVTRTSPESEYSATPVAGGGFTAVRVEADSTQRLWRFDDDGSNARVVFEHIRPVGYHAWADGERAALFVLGQPATLQVADSRTGEAKVVESRIGRALQRVPGRTAVSFVHQRPPPEGAPAQAGWMLKMLDLDTGAVSEIAMPPYYADLEGDRQVVRGAEYHAWLPDGTLVTAAGSRLYAWNANVREWSLIADLTGHGIAISRLAVSPDGTRLAFVGHPVEQAR